MSAFTWQKQHLSQGKSYGAKELRCNCQLKKKKKKEKQRLYYSRYGFENALVGERFKKMLAA